MIDDVLNYHVSKDQVRETLNRAADRLARTGWQRDDDGPYGGPNCLAGAIQHEAIDYGAELAPDNHHHDQIMLGGRIDVIAQLTLCHTLGSETGDRDIQNYNDTVCPDEATAIDMLRRAVKDLENEGEASGTQEHQHPVG